MSTPAQMVKIGKRKMKIGKCLFLSMFIEFLMRIIIFSSGWVDKEKDKLKLSTLINTLIESNATECLVDFDNHLDNCELNWKNIIINDNLKALVSRSIS